MYIIYKELPFMPEPEQTPFYSTNKTRPAGTFNRVRAKVFRWYIHAWFVNLRFKGTIEKIKPAC
jgi:hypothetical protein